MARTARPERSRSARSSRQLSRFYHSINPDRVFGTHSAADLRGRVVVHGYWSRSDLEAPTWRRWLAVARNKWRDVPELKDMDHLSFREELHAIEAVIAGQGIGIFSNALVARELAAGTLVKAFDVSLPGYCFYVVRKPGHPPRENYPSLLDVVAVGHIGSLLLRVTAGPQRVKLRRTQCEHMFSALPSNSDITRCIRHVSNVPGKVIASSPRISHLRSCRRSSWSRCENSPPKGKIDPFAIARPSRGCIGEG